jgi:membrane dipeptidase
MHADTPYQLMKGKSMEKETDVHMSFERLRKGQVSAFAAVLFVESKFHEQGAASYCGRATKKIDDLLETQSDKVRPALAAADFEDNWRSGHVSLLRTLEGSWCLGGNETSIDALHASGIRMIGLTWENDHDFATSWTYHGHVGLTARGRKAVARMNELGIAVDASHMSDRAVEDVLAASKAPVFATHSNARSVCNHPRNLKDEHIRAIAGTGGIIGVNFYPLHLVKGGRATIADVVKHIRHLRDVGGIGSVGLGSDFDGIGRGPSGLETAAELPNLRKALLEDGFTEEEVASIFGGNFLRAMAGVERAARR